MKRRDSETSPRSLIRIWERVRRSGQIEDAAAKTAAALARVHDVPSEILDALDELLGSDYEGQGKAIYTVVSYLRRLDELDRLGLSGPD